MIFKGHHLEKMRYKRELLRVFSDSGVFYNCVIGSKQPQRHAADEKGRKCPKQLVSGISSGPGPTNQNLRIIKEE